MHRWTPFNFLSIALVCLTVWGCAAPVRKATTISEAPWQAYWHYTNGDLLELQGQPQKALEEYLKALEYDPRSADVRLAAARALGQLGGWQQAAAILEETVDLAPASVEAHLLLGDCYTHLERAGEAEKSYQKVLRLDHENQWALRRLAAFYEWRGDLQKADRQYEKLIGLVRHPQEIHLRRAAIFLRGGQLEKAADHFRRALELEGDLADAHRGLAQTYELMEQPDQAIAQYRSAIDQMPHRLDLRMDLAELLVRMGHPQEAIEQYRQVLAGDASNELALRRLAILLYYSNQFAEAHTILERLAEMMPRDAGVQLYLGRAMAGEEDLDGAIDHFQQAVALDDSLADGWVGLGIAYLQKEDLEGAEEALKRGVLKVPDDARIFHLLGVSHLRRERYLPAVGTLERALRLAPDHIGIMRDLANSYERAGYFQKAVDLFQQVLSRQPEDHWAMNYLGYMLADAGVRLEQAEQLVEKALQLNPENGYYLDSMGWVYFRLGRLELAEEYLVRAVAELPDQTVMHDHLGDVYLQQGRPEEALQQWRRALQLSPDDEQIRHKLEQHQP